MNFLKSKRENGKSLEDCLSNEEIKENKSLKQNKRLNVVDMSDIIQEITEEINKEKKGLNKTSSLLSPLNGYKKSLPANLYKEKVCPSEKKIVLTKRISKGKIKKETNSVEIKHNEKVEFLKSREIQISFIKFERVAIKYKQYKSNVKVEYFNSSIHKPDIINIKSFCSESVKIDFEKYLNKLSLAHLAQFLAENVLSCMTFYTEDLTVRDKQTLENYYKIIHLFQFDDNFAFLENVLTADKILIMIESSKFPYSSCLPAYEFFILAVDKTIFTTNQSNKVELQYYFSLEANKIN
jgi:hypothetical protein